MCGSGCVLPPYHSSPSHAQGLLHVVWVVVRTLMHALGAALLATLLYVFLFGFMLMLVSSIAEWCGQVRMSCRSAPPNHPTTHS